MRDLVAYLDQKYDFEDKKFIARRKYRLFMDTIVVYPSQRWVYFGLCLVSFLYRVMSTGSYGFLLYCLGVMYLKNLILFLQPQDELMSELEIAVEGDFVLPMKESDEFKPFERKRPEMEVWKQLSFFTTIALVCTFFEFFNFDVHPLILTMYFLLLCVLVFRAKIKHMLKYKYNPFEFGKKKGGINRYK
uniref:Protein RER1 n=1 Tax=Strombidium rassoulzadegani TaxID=1082188 RepID=A0A7S3CJG4_9SPIT|mmetsp:Transcript_12761/g.21547  ORF Transcript_12761/g.21547 Transcript_12761/m.21547 type:complete len:189 (+) Transcript_12761:146-712(+)